MYQRYRGVVVPCRLWSINSSVLLCGTNSIIPPGTIFYVDDTSPFSVTWTIRQEGKLVESLPPPILADVCFPSPLCLFTQLGYTAKPRPSPCVASALILYRRLYHVCMWNVARDYTTVDAVGNSRTASSPCRFFVVVFFRFGFDVYCNCRTRSQAMTVAEEKVLVEHVKVLAGYLKTRSALAVALDRDPSEDEWAASVGASVEELRMQVLLYSSQTK